MRLRRLMLLAVIGPLAVLFGALVGGTVDAAFKPAPATGWAWAAPLTSTAMPATGGEAR